MPRYVVIVFDSDGEHRYPVADEATARDLARVFEGWGGRTEIRARLEMSEVSESESPSA